MFDTTLDVSNTS